MYCDTQHFFEEQYTAFLEGRNSGSDPSKGWYKGEIWFFDNYSEFLSDLSFAVLLFETARVLHRSSSLPVHPTSVIPLAKKLKDCGVFGVSSDEYLNYAMMNREEWEKRGEEVVARFVEKYSQKTIKEGREGEEESEDSPTVASTLSDQDTSNEAKNNPTKPKQDSTETKSVSFVRRTSATTTAA